jgi:hypothetical protein
MLELALGSRLGRHMAATGKEDNRDQLRIAHALTLKKLIEKAKHYTPSDFIAYGIGTDTTREMTALDKAVISVLPAHLVGTVRAILALPKAFRNML